MLSVITDPEELFAVADEWRALWRADPRATPFQSPEWLLAWWKHLFGGGQLWTVVQRRDGQLVSLLPMFRWGAERENLSFIGAGITDYLDILGEPIDSIPGDWTTANLDGIRPDSTLLALGPHEPCNVCPTLELPGSMEELIRAVEPKLAVDVKRSTNRLRHAGEVRIERTADPDHFIRLHQSRWEERHESGMLAEHRIQQFHRDVAAGFDRVGVLRLYQILLNENPIGAIYAFSHRRRTYAYLSGFDPTFAKLSPGTVLLAHVVERAIEEGCTHFDFLRDPEPYKYRWAAVDQPIYRLQLNQSAR